MIMNKNVRTFLEIRNSKINFRIEKFVCFSDFVITTFHSKLELLEEAENCYFLSCQYTGSVKNTLRRVLFQSNFLIYHKISKNQDTLCYRVFFSQKVLLLPCSVQVYSKIYFWKMVSSKKLNLKNDSPEAQALIVSRSLLFDLFVLIELNRSIL